MPSRPAPTGPRLTRSVSSLYLWGPVREKVNQLASRAAQGIDRHFAWVEVSDSQSEEWATSAPGRGIAAPTRAFTPPRGVSADRMWTVLRETRQRRAVQELDSFLKMSEPIQQAIGQLLERDGPRVLAIANLERLREFFCAEEAGPHPFIQWLKAREITLVASSTGEPLPEGGHFDYLVTQPVATRVVVRPPVVAICQRGDPDPSFLQQVFRPHGVVCLAGLSPSARASPIPVARLARP
jgi:hypothetical protein